MTYHITPAGDAKLCRAVKRACPYGPAEEHYATAAQAREGYERLQLLDGFSMATATRAEGHELLTRLGIHLAPLTKERGFPRDEEYYGGYHEALQELREFFPLGSSGQEKVMVTHGSADFVLKLAAAEEEVSYSSSPGLTSLAEEAHAGGLGFAGRAPFAKTHLLWHASGTPLLLQEKLTHLTTRVDDKLHEELPWLPQGLTYYAQVGRSESGAWKLYDLDAGSTVLFHAHEEEGRRELESIYDDYFQRS